MDLTGSCVVVYHILYRFHASVLAIARAGGIMFSGCLYVHTYVRVIHTYVRFFVNTVSQERFEGFSLNSAQVSTVTQGELIRFWPP